MRQLNTVQNYIFLAGALMMVAGAGCVVFGFHIHVTSLVFALGSICFALMQMSQTYDGSNVTLRRLRRIMVFADVFFILAGLLMVENVYNMLFPYIATTVEGYSRYVQIVHNNWVVALLIAAILEMYTTHRISYELDKEEKKTEDSI